MNHFTPHSQALFPLYVVILNWNLPEDTIQCVESVQAGAPAGVQIVVVDNGSSDNSLQQFREHFGDTLTIVANPQNLGFAAGVNAGIQQALAEGAQSVLLLNNDTIVDREMIHHLLAAATQSPRVGIVGPAIYYYDRPELIWRYGDRQMRWLPLTRRLPERLVYRACGVPFRVDYVTACGMLVQRQVFETIGTFDTCYFMYFEDADFCQRARQAGYEIWCAPQARMWHKVSLSAQKIKPLTRYAESWGRARFYRTYSHGFSRGPVVAYLLAKSIVTTVRDLLANEPELLRPLWTGFLDGQRDRPSRMFDFQK